MSRYLSTLGAAIPPLLEEFAVELTLEALDRVPLRIEEDNPLSELLRNARLFAPGRILRRSPVELFERVAGSREPRAVTEIINSSRRLAEELARLVGRSIELFASRNDVVSPEELGSDENRAGFVDVFVTNLRGSEEIPEVSMELVDDMVRRALRRAPSQPG